MSTGGVKGFSTLAVALVIFGLAGSAVAVTVPALFATGAEAPGFAVFLAAGVAAILLTAGLFYYVDRLGMGFGKTALALAAGYNALIAAVKLGVAPAAMYEANRNQSFSILGGDPNSPLYYAVVGAVVLVLYLAVFRVMYALFKRRFRRRAEQTERADAWAANQGILLAVLVVAVVAILAVFVSSGVLFLVVAAPVYSYLVYVFATFGAVIALALGLAAVLAYKTFDEVEKRAARLGDATLLANFFWLGLALLLLYHAMWAVFLLALVSIWPFRTYTPK